MLFTRLSDWIRPEHLQDSRIDACAQSLAAAPAQTLVIDNFLVPARYADLQATLREAGRLQPVYALAGQGRRRATQEQWLAASAQQRFYHHLEVVGPRPGFELSRAYLTHVSLSDVVATRPFLDYFARIGGRHLAGITQVNGKVIGREQMLRPHSDAEPGRRLCAVLYLNDDWRPEYGGRFLLYRNGLQVDHVDPIGNRLLLFVPDSGYLHAVEALTDAAGDWLRWNYSFWMHDGTVPPGSGLP